MTNVAFHVITRSEILNMTGSDIPFMALSLLIYDPARFVLGRFWNWSKRHGFLSHVIKKK